MKNRIALILLTLSVSGCSTIGLQSKRIFQDEVRKPVIKEVDEDIKEAADYLAKEVEEPQEAADVALVLSQRVGQPESVQTSPKAIKQALSKGNQNYQKDIDDLNKWLDKREGTELEGTGLSVWGTGGVLIIAALIAIVILVPAIIPLLLQVIRAIAGTSRKVTISTINSFKDGVDEFNSRNPKAAEELKEILSRRMDKKEKAIIKKSKSSDLR